MSRIFTLAAATLLCVALPACNPGPQDAAQPVAVGSAGDNLAAPVPAETLRAQAEQAMREQRLFAPAGNNALEYFLALHRQQPDDPRVQAGLVDLQPLLVIAIEQAIGRGALPEGQRLVRHLQTMDANAPALGRLQATLADAERLAMAREVAVDDDARAKADADALALRQQAEANALRLTAARSAPATPSPANAVPAPSVPSAIAASAETAPAPSRQQATPAPVPPRAEPVAATPPPAQEPVRTASAQPPRQVRVVAPVYPAAERSRGLEGQVQVAFTIGADGNVEDSRVVSSTLPNVFSRAALSAVARWKFEASGNRHPSQRTLVFSPTGG